MIVYKIIDQNMKTGHDFKLTEWKIGVPVELGKSKKLNTHKWLYAYEHPLLAVLHNPIHANYKNGYRLFEAEAEGEIEKGHQMVLRCTKLTLLKEIDVPKITQKQRTAYGILCAKALLDKTWYTWATNWLSGKYREKNAVNITSGFLTILITTLFHATIAKYPPTVIVLRVSNAARKANVTIDLVELAKQALAINSTDGGSI
jgi:hypothetical protein